MRYLNRVKRRPPPTPWRSKFVARADREYRYRDRVYAAIVEYAGEHCGATPTVREIMEMVGISSTSVAAYNVKLLIGMGKLAVVDRKLLVVGSRWIGPDEENNIERNMSYGTAGE